MCLVLCRTAQQELSNNTRKIGIKQKPKTMNKKAEEFFRKEKIARSEGIVKKLNKIVNFDMEGEILEAYAKEQNGEQFNLLQKNVNLFLESDVKVKALEKQVEELKKKEETLIGYFEILQSGKSWPHELNAVIEEAKVELLKEKE